MSKENFFKKYKATERRVQVELPADSGLPPLYAKALKHGEFSDLFEVVKVKGKPTQVLNYSRAIVASIVIAGPKSEPYFTEDDLPQLEELVADGASPFVRAINEVNGIAPKAEAGDGNCGTPSPNDSGSAPPKSTN